jgi:hypothetical protein
LVFKKHKSCVEGKAEKHLLTCPTSRVKLREYISLHYVNFKKDQDVSTAYGESKGNDCSHFSGKNSAKKNVLKPC